MSSFFLRPLRDALQRVSNSLVLLLSAGLLQIGIFALLRWFSTQMERDYGAPTPDLHVGFYESPSDFTDTLSTWGPDGCRAYLRLDLLVRCVYIPTYVTLLNAVLYRSISKIGGDAYVFVVPQLAVAMLLADFGETAIWAFGCCGWNLPLVAIVMADLCHKVKTVSILMGAGSLVVLMVLKSYMMPFLVMAKQTDKTSAKTTSYKKTAGGAKKSSTAVGATKKKE
jgi:hypothetical protein